MVVGRRVTVTNNVRLVRVIADRYNTHATLEVIADTRLDGWPTAGERLEPLCPIFFSSTIHNGTKTKTKLFWYCSKLCITAGDQKKRSIYREFQRSLGKSCDNWSDNCSSYARFTVSLRLGYRWHDYL